MKPKKAQRPGILQVLAKDNSDEVSEFHETRVKGAKKINTTTKLRQTRPAPYDLGVVVTCHPPYLKNLPTILAIIDKALARKKVQKVLCLDNCENWPYQVPKNGWKIIHTNHGGPGLGRNLGMAEASKCSWFVFWDADNIPTQEFFNKCFQKITTAPENVGLYYSTVISADTNKKISNDKHKDVREGFFTDTASLWRSAALMQANGWSTNNNTAIEDWELALTIQQNGWKIDQLGASIRWKGHAGNRTRSTHITKSLWESRPIGIVTLMRGNESFLELWYASIMNMELPPHYGITIVDDSNDDDFNYALVSACHTIDADRITILKGFPPNTWETSFNTVHSRVGGLYAKAIQATPEPVILTWEDDVFPESINDLKELSSMMIPGNKIAAVAGCYTCRTNPNAVVAGIKKDKWGPQIRWDEVHARKGPINIGMCGFGFTLWSRKALEECPILGQFTLKDGFPLGADGFLCRRLNKAGWRLILNTNVRATHEI